MNSLKVFLLITLLMLLVACTNDQKSEPKQVTVNDALIELNSIAIEFNGSSPDQNSTDLKLVKGLGDAKIVGLGEATHGSKEFFEMKHRIFKYLTEERGFRIFGFECELAESLYLDHYITTGEILSGDPDLRSMMKSKVHFWTWQVEEIAVLIEWMREFNKGRAEDDMVHLYGVDCQSLKDAVFFYKRLFNQYKPELTDEFGEFLEWMDSIRNPDIKLLSVSDKEKLKSGLKNLKSRITESKPELLGVGERNYMIYERIPDVLLQVFYQKTGSPGKRDTFMGDNAVWFSELNGGGVVLWAHNGHSCVWKGNMGARINSKIGDEYQTVGFGFAKGSLRAIERKNGTYTGLKIHNINREPLEGSINELFYKADLQNLVISMDSVKNKENLRIWLNTGRTFQNIGAVYSAEDWERYYGDKNVNLYLYCDFFFWFRNVEAAKGL